VRLGIDAGLNTVFKVSAASDVLGGAEQLCVNLSGGSGVRREPATPRDHRRPRDA
jgi:hypothetical protein